MHRKSSLVAIIKSASKNSIQSPLMNKEIRVRPALNTPTNYSKLLLTKRKQTLSQK